MKTFYWTYFYKSIGVMIPRKKGEGYLKTPIGHHRTLLSDYFGKKYTYDLCGIDGYLNIDVRRVFPYLLEAKDFCLPIVKYIVDFYNIQNAEIKYMKQSKFFNFLLKQKAVKG